MKHYFKSIKKAKKANESASWAETLQTSQKLLSVNYYKHEKAWFIKGLAQLFN